MGELAALTVAVLWSLGSFLFAFTSRALGALATNRLRITVAMAILWGLHFVVAGHVLPSRITGEEWALLAVSAVMGLVVGDSCYFRALVLVGPRLATMTMSLAPAFTALLGWIWLGETLGPRALLGMALTLGGIAWVVRERAPAAAGRGQVWLGLVLGVGGSLGQAVGLVLAKQALWLGVAPLGATVVRMTVAALASWLMALLLGGVRSSLDGLRVARVRAALVLAATLGPVFGVWLSLVAVRLTTTAIAATLMALVPVIVLPLGYVFHRERPTWRAVSGAALAVVGVVLLVTRSR